MIPKNRSLVGARYVRRGDDCGHKGFGKKLAARLARRGARFAIRYLTEE